jgi:Uma2 family endonuclease
MITASKAQDSAAQPKKISWSEFQKRYLTREDKYKYEWLNGVVEKTERAMNQYQLFIETNLIRFFRKLSIAGQVNGELFSEVDTFFLENHRKPDIAYFTDEQINRAAYGKNQVPQFVIEVVSTNDKMNKNQRKIQDYRKAGVQVIWYLYPELEEVHIYRGKNVVICSGEDICSAAPVLLTFALTANDIFQKPALLEEEL